MVAGGAMSSSFADRDRNRLNSERKKYGFAFVLAASPEYRSPFIDALRRSPEGIGWLLVPFSWVGWAFEARCTMRMPGYLRSRPAHQSRAP